MIKTNLTSNGQRYFTNQCLPMILHEKQDKMYFAQAKWNQRRKWKKMAMHAAGQRKEVAWMKHSKILNSVLA